MVRTAWVLATVGITTACSSGSTRALSATPAATPEGRIAQLAAMFDFERDVITGEGWYTVKDPFTARLVRKRIEPVVHSSGRIYMRSIYRDDGWLFHDQVQARVGDRVLETAKVPSFDRRNSRRVLDGKFIGETIAFTDGADNGILDAIAAEPALPVVVRFVGRDAVHTQEMSEDDKRRIAAGVELARLLRARHTTASPR